MLAMGALQPLAQAWTVLVGACLGSFVNVVVARLPQALSVVRPRSRCPRCMAGIAWYDNVPLLSYLLLRGRCRACRASIAARYPLVEGLMAALAGALFVRYGFSAGLLVWLPLTAALLAVAFIDIDYWWVPDVITLPAMGWALATAWLPGRPGLLAAALGVLPAALLWLTGWLISRIGRREALGLGDVKLLAALGMALGPRDALAALALASLQGAAIGALVIAFGGHRGAPGPLPAALADDADWQPDPHAVPFGPFLVLGALQVVLLPDLFAALQGRLLAALLPLLS